MSRSNLQRLMAGRTKTGERPVCIWRLPVAQVPDTLGEGNEVMTERGVRTKEPTMWRTKRLVLGAAALLMMVVAAAGAALGQQADIPEGAIPLPRATPVESVDPGSLMPALYFLVVLVAAVAVAATILLATGRGDLRGRKELTEGERRLGRMLGESKTAFDEGRAEGELPTQMK